MRLKIVGWLRKRRLISTISLMVILGGGFLIFQGAQKNGSNQVSYTTEAATVKTLTTSISGTGQVAAQNQLDLKPKVSGEANDDGSVTAKSVQVRPVN